MDSALFGSKSPIPKTPPSGAKAADSSVSKGKAPLSGTDLSAFPSHANSASHVDEASNASFMKEHLAQKTKTAPTSTPTSLEFSSSRSRRGSSF